MELTKEMNWIDVALAAVEACFDRGETDHKAAVQYILDWMENDPKGFKRLENEAWWKFLTNLVEDVHGRRRRGTENVNRSNGMKYKEQTRPRARGASNSPVQKRLNEKRNKWLVWTINGCLLADLDGPAMLERAQHLRGSASGSLRTAIFLEKVAAKVKNQKMKDCSIANDEGWFDRAMEAAKAESMKTAGIVG